MGTMSIWHWLVVALVVVLLFGSGRISSVMGDVAKGIKAFRRGMQEEEKPQDQARVEAQPAAQPTTTAPAQQPTTAAPAQPASPAQPATAAQPQPPRA